MSFKRSILRALALAAIMTGVVACGRSKANSGEERQASIVLETNEIWMGSFPAGSGRHTVVFPFRNAGDADLELLDADTSCWCVSTDFPRKPIKPGRKGEITVTVDVSDKKPGTFNHHVYFVETGSPSHTALTIKGEITEK